ncbi:MAG TPA: DNA-directed RNA polymerase subunit alpha [Firmicutes bacterium]|nr:DNA-directed RNA polymerase subunit alpha [Bacillota bacterium]
MNLNWLKIKKPAKIACDEKTKTTSYGKFSIEPFERGFATTIGNSLRRVLLSSIVGSAIIGVKIDGISHEFSTMEGVYEDVTQIIMNLKKVQLKVSTPEIISIHLTRKGPGEIKAKDFEALDERIHILNPDQHILTMNSNKSISMKIDFGLGRGYSSAEENRRMGLPVDYIPVDSIFTPVTKVAIDVEEEVRIEAKDNFERLIIEIWTNKAILPEDALAYSAKILKEQMNIFINFEEVDEEEVLLEPEQDDEKINRLLEKSVNELELSKRPANCLKMANIKTLGDLVQKTHQDMMEFRNFGQKSLLEIKEKLAQYNLSLGMKIEQIPASGGKSKKKESGSDEKVEKSKKKKK